MSKPVKTELLWLAAFALLSTLIVGIATGFGFNTLDIKLHDTYFVVRSAHAVKLLTLIFVLGRFVCWMTNRITERYVVLAILFSIVNAIVGLFVIILTYFSIGGIAAFRQSYPGTDMSGNFILPGICFSVLVVQVVVEVKMIAAVRRLVSR